MKNIRFFLSEKLPFFGGKIFSVFEYACFRNGSADAVGAFMVIFFQFK